ncbi:hypothetical protein [Paenarthrobacter aurescens]|uniref:Integral membrane protein n=1 Tax=Paenarthrobacter aurescens (strain TC1) TaxID=290340 RepID=A1RBT4_PAEAT|nr:hypothetical protein [Paenarthrobacter aurescens]ABM06377.1 putative integral membrane protein [Paenarthrobacter aurescens TC1]
MEQLYAILACIILGLLAIFQLALVAGAPIGRFAWGGQHEVLPRKLRIGSIVSILLYVPFGYTALAKAGLVPALISQPFTDVFMWVLTAYFTLGVGMNAISRSKPERLVMTPVALVLAVLFLLLSLG